MNNDTNEIEMEIFRAGNYGAKGRYSEAELQALAEDYRPELLEAPLTFDHAQTGPAYGWVTRVRRDGDRLLAVLRGVPDAVRQLVRSGAFKQRSVELVRELQQTGRPYLRAVTLLGAATPEVKGLSAIRFSAAEAVEKIATIAKPESAVQVGRAFLPGSSDHAAQSDPVAQENTEPPRSNEHAIDQPETSCMGHPVSALDNECPTSAGASLDNLMPKPGRSAQLTLADGEVADVEPFTFAEQLELHLNCEPECPGPECPLQGAGSAVPETGALVRNGETLLCEQLELSLDCLARGKQDDSGEIEAIECVAAVNLSAGGGLENPPSFPEAPVPDGDADANELSSNGGVDLSPVHHANEADAASSTTDELAQLRSQITELQQELRGQAADSVFSKLRAEGYALPERHVMALRQFARSMNDDVIQFSETESAHVSDWLRDFLRATAPRVPLGVVAANTSPAPGAVPQELQVHFSERTDPASIDMHHRAVALMQHDISLGYSAALSKASKG